VDHAKEVIQQEAQKEAQNIFFLKKDKPIEEKKANLKFSVLDWTKLICHVIGAFSEIYSECSLEGDDDNKSNIFRPFSIS
jgi:hypothetical protein